MTGDFWQLFPAWLKKRGAKYVASALTLLCPAVGVTRKRKNSSHGLRTTKTAKRVAALCGTKFGLPL